MATKKTTDKTTEKPTKRKMRPGGGKAKGSTFEGKIAKALTAALPLTFIRSPGSGARVGGQNFEKFGSMFGADAMKLFVADVVPTNEKDTGYNFLWSIECKSYATTDNFNHLVAGTANIFKWFEESVIDSAKVNKKPMLVFKWNNTKTYVIIQSHDNLTHEPVMRMKHKDGRDMAVYLFDDIISEQTFWLEKT